MKRHDKKRILISSLVAILVLMFNLINIINTSHEMNLSDKKIKSLESSLAEYKRTLDKQNKEYEEVLEMNRVLTSKNEELSSSYLEGNEKLKEYEEQIQDFKESTASQAVASDRGFRSWMPYTAISASSKQGSIIAQASPNEYGILEIDGRACVAIGTGWGLSLGDTATVYTKNGSYDIIVSDIKADAHTDSTRKVTVHNGCVVEFIVDTSCLDNRIRVSGSVASIPEYAGIVTDIK